ncbi:TPA: hypothetical protein ACGGN0_004526, partial [Escherichia coli]
ELRLKDMSVNESEERLLNSTKKTFLSMWSHSNIFYKKGKERKGKERKGKEFCDVMVVFGNDVIIMSDKLINLQQRRHILKHVTMQWGAPG